MSVSVHSEISFLRRVLLHRPGAELEQLTPSHLARMLFDDIPYLSGAQKEHDAFAETLRRHGTQVVYLADLMAETIKQDDALKRQFIREFVAEAGPVAGYYAKELIALLSDIADEETLVLKTISGVTDNELTMPGRHPLVDAAGGEMRFLLDPIPNLYFTRDPFAVVGNGVVLSRMSAQARHRETIYGRYILSYHRDYAERVPMYYDHLLPFSIEGGDILNLGRGLLAIGISQRTTPEAIEILARTLFSRPEAGIEAILALDIPNIRAYMHLDTVFTQVDHGAFAVHPGILRVLHVYRITPGAKGGLVVKAQEGELDAILARNMGTDKVTLINCGGMDVIASQREQWNDASNTLCIAPGKVIVYDRNSVTNAILRDHGITTIEIPGAELGRGRGGPRCMSMPLLRDSIV